MNRNFQKLRDRRNLSTRPVSQFSLRTLLLVTTAVALGILFLQELAERFGIVAAFVAILAALSIFAHVAGAAIGSRFRTLRSESAASDIDDEVTEHHQPLKAVATDFAPRTELSRQQPLTRKPIYWSVGIGACGCATVAAFILTLVMWQDLAIVNVLFGAFSAAVLGGLLGFWIGSFFQVVRSALADAQKES